MTTTTLDTIHLTTGCPGGIGCACNDEQRCPCTAEVHGPDGCQEEARPNPEDWQAAAPCIDCTGYAIFGRHGMAPVASPGWPR